MSDARAVIAATLPAAQAPCITSSFQAECVVLTHMLREARPDMPVLFLETFHHFRADARLQGRADGRSGA